MQLSRRIVVISGISIALTLLAHFATLGDVDTKAWKDYDSGDWVGASVLLFALAPIAIYLAVRTRESVARYLIGASIIPLVSLSIGLLNADNRRWQLEAREVFVTYTQRFPKGRLHDVYVRKQTDRYLTVCASEGEQNRNSAPGDRRFCIEVIVGDNRQDKVQGGYRFNTGVVADPEVIEEPEVFDCFGKPIACS